MRNGKSRQSGGSKSTGRKRKRCGKNDGEISRNEGDVSATLRLYRPMEKKE